MKILLAEYQQSIAQIENISLEADLENPLISDLVNSLNYERLDIHTPAEL